MSESAAITSESTQLSTNENVATSHLKTVDEPSDLNLEGLQNANIDLNTNVGLEKTAEIAAGNTTDLQNELRDALNNGANAGDIDESAVQTAISQSNNVANSANAALTKSIPNKAISAKSLKRRKNNIIDLTNNPDETIEKLQNQENYSIYAASQELNGLSPSSASMLQENQQRAIDLLPDSIIEHADIIVQKTALAKVSDPMLKAMVMNVAISALPHSEQETVFAMTNFELKNINNAITRFSEEGLLNPESLNQAVKNLNNPETTNDLSDKQILAIYSLASVERTLFSEIESYMNQALQQMKEAGIITEPTQKIQDVKHQGITAEPPLMLELTVKS
jgi:hypothetical protein